MSTPTRCRGLLSGVLVMALAAGCTVASPHPDAYRERTKLAVTDAVGHVATAQKVLEAARADMILRSYAVATVRSSDDTLNTAVGAYLELYPPEGMDPRFTKAGTLLGEATDLVTESRVALYRNDRGDYPQLIKDLAALGRRLDRFEGELS